MPRPAVDIVVPFAGDQDMLADVVARLGRISLREGDTVAVVDNTPRCASTGADPPERWEVTVLTARGRLTPGYARNRGAEHGQADWVVFLDADTEARSDLLDRYFDPPPAPETGLLAGGVIDERVAADAPGPARYAYLRSTLSQDRTLEMGHWAFAQTANVACRRIAFESIGGFREDIRAGEDADLSYRLKDQGWEIERREEAAVVHRSRRTLREFVSQAALHGAGSAWVERNYPGSFPSRRRPGLIWWAIRTVASGSVAAAMRRDRDLLVRALYEPLWELTFEFGRSLSAEERPTRRRRSRDNLRPR